MDSYDWIFALYLLVNVRDYPIQFYNTVFLLRTADIVKDSNDANVRVFSEHMLGSIQQFVKRIL